MADYDTLLDRAIGRLQSNTDGARRDIYAKARSAVVGELKAISPPLAPAEMSRRELELEEAIRRVERKWGPGGAARDAVVPPAASAAGSDDDGRRGRTERREPGLSERESDRPPPPQRQRSISSRLLLLVLLALVFGGATYAVYTYRAELEDLFASLTGGGEPTDPSAATADAGVGPDAGTPEPAVIAAVIPGQSYLYEAIGGGDAPAHEGTVDWAFVDDADGPRIEVRIDIPDRAMQVVLSMRKAPETATGVSHSIEAILTIPPDNPGGTVQSIAQLVAKTSEDAIGTAIVARSAQVSPGQFLLDFVAENERQNMLQMRRDWFDLGFVYANGDRALVTFSKGSQGHAVMQQAVAAWQD